VTQNADLDTYLNAFIFDELDSRIRVLQLLGSQFGMLLVLTEIFGTDDFQQLNEQVSVFEVVL